MRIIGGIHKGRRLQPPRQLPVRPTTDLSREALFNVLHHHFEWETLHCLDLFAGTGAISYECMSRGAAQATAVDQFKGCIQFIRQTAAQLDMPIQAVQSDVFAFLQKWQGQADVVFADPPYQLPQADYDRLVRLLFDRNLVAAEGWVVVEHDKHIDLSGHSEFQFIKKYGATVFSFFEATRASTP